MNPKDESGKYLTCHARGAFRHMVIKCPHSWENIQASEKVNVSDDNFPIKDDTCLFLQYWVLLVLVQFVGKNGCNVFSARLMMRKIFHAMLTGKKVFKFGGGEKLNVSVIIFQSKMIHCYLYKKKL